MTLILYFILCEIIIVICKKNNIEPPSNNTMLILAILTGCEVISWRVNK